MTQKPPHEAEGILLVNKAAGKTSFTLVAALRKRLGVRKIGHAGTLDPFATGVMVMLIGRRYTRLSDSFLCEDKEYRGRLFLGKTTDTYDCEGSEIATSSHIPSQEDIERVLTNFQGEIEQIPPMYSAKKIQGKKLYELARKGVEIERQPVKIHVKTTLLAYDYPYVDIQVTCSKGTYIRSIAYDIGQMLGCGAHLSSLVRTRSGCYLLEDCIEAADINDATFNLLEKIQASADNAKHGHIP